MFGCLKDLFSGCENVSLGPQTAGDYVRGLQRDGRLLLRFLARRSDRPLGTIVPVQSNQSGSIAAYSLLTKEKAEDIAADPEDLALLIACVDDLGRRAAPATVSTIRLSSAYLCIPLEDGEPYPNQIARRARALKCGMNLIVLVALLATVLAVLLLAHVDSGQRAAQQLEAARARVAQIDADLLKLRPDAWRRLDTSEADGAFVGLCSPGGLVRPAPGSANTARTPSNTEAGIQAAALCGARTQEALRIDLIYLRIAEWNCRTYRISNFRWGRGRSCGPLAPAPPMAVDDALGHWRRTEIRAASTISMLTGFVLPLLMGCIGGCAYVLRRLDQKLSQWALEFNDGSHSWVRILLATMLGGILGVLWTGNQQVQLGGFALSLAAFAFFVGFSLEIVFTVIEAMVSGVAGKLSAPPPVPAALQAAPAVQMPRPERKPEAPARRADGGGAEGQPPKPE